jgi:hypothetical protein
VREYGIVAGERYAQAVRRLMLLSGMTDWEISTVSYGAERPLHEVPANATAGVRNEIARRNAGVDVVFLKTNRQDGTPVKECSDPAGLDVEQVPETEDASNAK